MIGEGLVTGKAIVLPLAAWDAATCESPEDPHTSPPDSFTKLMKVRISHVW
jgi:hypothetical protein